MSILDKLKLKKAAPAKETAAKQKAESKSEGKSAQMEKRAKTTPIKNDTGNAYQVLMRPWLSEKGTSLASSSRYVFSVHPKANKIEIRKSIEKVYDVHVEAVNIVKLPGKKRRYGRTHGKTSEIKKAIITLRTGERIAGIAESVG